ncbi:MAG: hypothetical protein E4H27_01945 [Anaerolineales bacterium]|nr:MAG: hypothetical protein E4H27_01945 [Anaerolineales bacterium]
MPNYLLIGHVTCDVLEDGSEIVGGTAAYAALTANAIGFSVGILTSAASDFDFSRLAPVNNIVIKASPATTTFRNVYTEGVRHQLLYASATKLTYADLPETWRAPLIAHLGPVFCECDVDFFMKLRRETYIGVTLQGWLRQNKSGQRVEPYLPVGDMDFLRNASAVIVSEDDILGDWQYAKGLAEVVPLLVVTCGSRGGYIYQHKQRVAFAAPQVSEYNPTGAGDIFAAAFFCAAVRGYDAYAASLFASCIAAQSVTRMGLASISTPSEVCQCSFNNPEV